MRKECPKVVPQPQAIRIELIRSSARIFAIGRMSPLLSRHENNGSSLSAGTICARLWRAAKGHKLPCSLRKTDCISPMRAVLAEGRSKRAYGLPRMSTPKKACALVRCLEGLNAAREVTDTSPKRIMPKKAQDAIAQMQASKESDNERVALRAVSIARVTGGRRGFRRPPCMFSRPRRDQLMRLWCESDRGGGQP